MMMVDISLPVGIIIGCLMGIYWQNKRTAKIRRRANKDSQIINVQATWLELHSEGRSIAEFFHKHHYKNIAIQGLGKLGCALLEELKTTDIQVAYGIDRNRDAGSELGIHVLSTDEDLASVDAVIITAIADYNTVATGLYQKLDCPLIPIDALMNELVN